MQRFLTCAATVLLFSCNNPKPAAKNPFADLEGTWVQTCNNAGVSSTRTFQGGKWTYEGIKYDTNDCQNPQFVLYYEGTYSGGASVGGSSGAKTLDVKYSVAYILPNANGVSAASGSRICPGIAYVANQQANILDKACKLANGESSTISSSSTYYDIFKVSKGDSSSTLYLGMFSKEDEITSESARPSQVDSSDTWEKATTK